MKWLKVILFLQILLLSFSLVGQNKQIEKANKRYQIKKYAEAIPLYEQGLEKNRSLSAQVRLAYCYRVNNNVEKAANLYGEIVLNKRARPITWFYYGESLIGQGQYEEAKKWLQKYTEAKPNDKKGWTLLESVDKVQSIEPYFKTNDVEAFSQNSESDESAPVFFNNGIAFSSDRKTGIKMMKKKSSWTGRDFLSLYFSKQKSDGTYGSPSQLSRRLNDMNKNTGTITIAPDGTYAVFSRNSDVSNRKNVYNLMLYRADLTSEGKFRNVKLLSFCGSNVNYMHPTFSPDGNTLYFTSDKKGEGGTDIFYVEKKGEKDWTRPKNVGAPVNTSANEGFPFMSHDGKLYFCSKGHVSYGGFDILVSERDKKGNWKQPINVGKPINSPADDISIFIAADGKKGVFASSRDGGDDDIYFFDIQGFNDVKPSSGFNDQPLTNNPSNDQTEMASNSSSNENKEGKQERNSAKKEAKKLPFEIVGSSETSDDENEIPASEKTTSPSDFEQGNDVKFNSEENSNTEENSKLPFEPVEPFNEKVNENSTEVQNTTEENLNNPTEENLNNISSNSKLPFEPLEPFSEKVNENSSEVQNTVKENLNNPTEENSNNISSNSKLPLEPVEPFSEKINENSSDAQNTAKENLNNSTEEKLNNISSNSKLPFEPLEPFNEKTKEQSAINETDVTSENSSNTNTTESEDVFEIDLETLRKLENDSKKFEEGLATSDDSMTDEVSSSNESEEQGLTEIKDYLSHSTNEREAIFVLEKIKFAPKKYTISPNNSSDLEELFNLLQENPSIKIEVSAHTESIGDDRENMVISIKRATAIAGFLIRKGISTERVKVMGYGETQLLNHCSNNVNCSEEEHALNQRIEVKILE